MSNEQEFALPTASTSAVATNILNLNDDCLRAIISSECLSIFDLRSIVETHSRFGQVVDAGFPKRFKKFSVRLGDLRSNELEKSNTRRVLSNFGPFISEISISGYSDLVYRTEYRKEFDLMLNWVTEYCSNTLDSIKLFQLTITEELPPLFSKLQNISLKSCDVFFAQTLFSNCESLVDLELWGVIFDDHLNAFKKTFPKLERFAYFYYEHYPYPDVLSDSVGYDFFSRHPNLKAFSLSRAKKISNLLPIVADNCKQLAELDIDIGRNEDEVDLEKALSSILTFGHLKKLKIYCRFRRRNITKFIQELRHSNSLEFLALKQVQSDSEFIPALSKLTTLQVLAFEDCLGLTNLNSLGDLERLTELKIVAFQEYLDVDVVSVIERLINLKTLHLDAKNFQLDQQTYLRIVDVVRGRPGRYPHALQITCRTANDGGTNSFADANCRKIVKIISS